MKAYGYIRVSTDKQEASGLGLEAQQAAIKKYCESAGLELAGGATDTSTGKNPRRRGLLAVLDKLHAGDILVVAKRDRLARDMMLSCWIEKEVTKRGASIVSAAGEGTDGDDPASKLMRQIVDAFAEYERSIISFRTVTALNAKRNRGELTGVAPYGYRRESPDSQKLVVDSAETFIINHAHDLHSRGKSLQFIADALNRMGKVNRAGKPFTKFGVRSMLITNKKRKAALK